MLDKDIKTDHKSKAAEILTGLAENLSPGDRKQAVQELGLSNVTIGDYLNGKVRDLDTAEKLIVFFRAIIQRRGKVLAGE